MEVACENQGALSKPEVAALSSSSSSRAMPCPLDISQPILELAEDLNMRIAHTKSQRKPGPARYLDSNWEPEKGSEVFVGRLPWNCDERELLPFLEQAGPIFEIRLMGDMKNGSGDKSCRGYCFAKYFSPEEAQLAVSLLHHQCIRKGWPVVISTNVENAKLVLFGVPSYISAKHVATEMKKFGNVSKVELLPGDLTCSPVPNSIAFVTFVHHRSAAGARKKMLESKPLLIWGKLIYVDWAESEGNLQPSPSSNQHWSLEEESYPVIVEATATPPPSPPPPPSAFPAAQPEPVYPVIQQIIPMIPVYCEQCLPSTLVSPFATEVTGEEKGFFTGNAHYSPPPPFIIHSAEGVFWYVPSPPLPLPLAQQACCRCEGCGCN